MVYLVTDDLGTEKLVLGMKRAMSWLPYCGPDARIRNLLGETVVRRTQRRVY